MTPTGPWTKQEDTWLLSSNSLDEYRQLAGDRARGDVAVINRRNRLKRNGTKIPEWRPGVPPVVYRDGGRVHIGEPESRLESEMELPARPAGPIERFYEAVKSHTEAKIELLDREKVINKVLPGEYVGVVFLGDLHIGGMIDYAQLERDLALIEQTDGLYAVGMGDYSENFQSASKLLKAMAEDVVAGSDDQLQLVAHVMGMTRKWWALCLGNHDGWSGPSGIRRLADMLGAEFLSEAGGVLRIQVGDERYIIYCKHQFRGHSSLNTSNESRRFWNEFPHFENADITVLAHYHQPDTHLKELKGQTVAHMRGGTWKQVDHFAEKLGFESGYGPSLVILNPHRHVVIPYHGPLWRYGVEHLQMLRARGRSDADLPIAREVIAAI